MQYKKEDVDFVYTLRGKILDGNSPKELSKDERDLLNDLLYKEIVSLKTQLAHELDMSCLCEWYEKN